MIVITATFQAKAGKEKELEEAFKVMIPLVRDEIGVIVYTLHRAKENPGRFFFYEQYRDKDAVDYHVSTPHVKGLSKKITELLAEPPVIEFFEKIEGI